MVVAFFGHKDAPNVVKPTVQRLIEENEEITFLVGTHGAFDLMAQGVLGQAARKYSQITCRIVLSYIPVKKNGEQYSLPTLVPEGIECVPKRFSISFSNNYMVNECDTVVCYITHDWGGAAQFVEKAEKRGKTVINLAEREKIKKP